MACLLKNEPASWSVSLVPKGLCPGGKAKASLNRATGACKSARVARTRPETA